MPALIAKDGTAIMNLLKPYFLCNSNIVFVYTYVLPVPVSILMSRLRYSLSYTGILERYSAGILLCKYLMLFAICVSFNEKVGFS